MKKPICIAVLLAASVLAFGCGGGGGGGESSDAPLTRAEFVRQGNAICKSLLEEGQEALQGLLTEHENASKPLTAQEKEQFVTEQIFPPMRDAIGELEELQPPAADRTKIEKLLREYSETLATVEKSPSKFYGGTAFEEPLAKARAYGLTSCLF